EIALDEGGIHVGRVAIEQPVLGARRDADGTLHAGGLALPPRPAAAPVAAATGDAPAPAAVEPTAPTSPPASAPAAPTPTRARAPAPPLPTRAPAPAAVIELGELALAGAQIDWSDATVAPAVATRLTVDAKLARLVLGRPADPASFWVDVGLRDAVEKLHVGG